MKMYTRLGKEAATLVAMTGLMLAAAGPAQAIKINAIRTQDSASVAKCKAGAFLDCKSEATISTISLDAGSAGFKSAFDAWNQTQAADLRWTLADGGSAPGGELTTNIFRAKATPGFGGVDLILDWSYEGADKSDYVWSQGLSLNYMPGQPSSGSTKAMFPALDDHAFNKLMPCNNRDYTTGSGNYFCGPAYPYQYGDRALNDGPNGIWADSSFTAYAFLSKLDRDARVLTLYEGVTYGFTLSATPVPEPGQGALALGGLCAMLTTARKRRARAPKPC